MKNPKKITNDETIQESINDKTMQLSEEEIERGYKKKDKDVSSDIPNVPDIEIKKKLSQGGMGVVYIGYQKYLARTVAVKVLFSHNIGDKSFVERFEREAKILANLSHPNIVACYQAGSLENKNCYIVMELVDGPDLNSYIKNNGTMSEKQALYILKKTAMALGYANEEGVIHRDIKPGNILLEKADLRSTAHLSLDDKFPFKVKLVDLGLARSTDEKLDQNITQQGQFIGTPSYMAPEQFNPNKKINHLADIYGLGGVLHFVLTGQNPYPYEDLTEIIQQKAQAANPKIYNKKLSKPVTKFVQDMLQPKKANRPQSYEEIIKRCDSILEQQEKKLSTTSIATFIVLVLVALGSYLYTKENKKVDQNVAKTSQSLKTSSKISQPKKVSSKVSIKTSSQKSEKSKTSKSIKTSSQKSKTSSKISIKKVKKWGKLKPLFRKTYVGRLKSWKKSGAVNWASSEEDIGVIGVGTGKTSFKLKPLFWRIQGSLKVPNKAKEAGISIEIEDRSFALNIQPFGKSYLISSAEFSKKRKILKKIFIKKSNLTFKYKIAYQNNKLLFAIPGFTNKIAITNVPKKISLYVKKSRLVHFYNVWIQYQE